MPETEAAQEAVCTALAPIAPVLGRGGLGWRRPKAYSMLLDASQALLTTSGRAALSIAFAQLNIGERDEVLLPAYHCLAMSAPVRACGATPVFYQLNADLSIHLEDLKEKFSPHCRCIVMVHFFGFPQALNALREFCDLTRVPLIEDCAHAFYAAQSSGMGRTGDFAIGSLMKFFPVFDGGCLVSFRRPLEPPRMTLRSLLFQLKALVNMIELAAAWSPGRLLRLVARAIQKASALAKSARPELTNQLADASPGAALGSLGFESTWDNTRMSLPSRFVLACSNHAYSIDRRRAIYLRYLSALAAVPGGEPLQTRLDDGVAPYVFPFILSNPDVAFPALRRAGVPLYRWENVAADACATARKYETALVQFPCHQALSDEEVGNSIRTIERVLRSSSITLR